MAEQIDRLEIEIESSIKGVDEPLTRLATALEKLKTAAGESSSVGKVAGYLNRLGSAINAMQDPGGKLEGLTNALKGISTLQKSNLNSYINPIKQLDVVLNGVKTADLSGVSGKLKGLVKELNPLMGMEKSNIGTYLNPLKNLEDTFKNLEKVPMDEFAAKIRQVTEAVKPLGTEMEKVANGFSAFPTRIQRLITQNERLSTSNRSLNRSYGVLGTGISAFKVKLLALYAVGRRVVSGISNLIMSSADYVEDLNLFTVSMGKYAEEAQNYADAVNVALGIDPGQWMRAQGTLMQIASGFGVAGDKAYTMSKNLTQLGYDLSSYFNISVETAMEKLQSGITGQVRPLRSLGYAIDQATLQEYAYSLGIKQSISNMTQAQQAQLRYIAIMDQSKNALQDLSRTLDTPSNSIRVFQQSITQLGRALGNILIPALNAVIPYVIALVNVLTMAAQAIAGLFGFTLPTIDYSGIGDATAGVIDLEDSLSGAGGAAQKLQETLLGFDEVNVLRDMNASGGGSGGGGLGGDLGIDLSQWDYDFLGDVNSRVKEITDSILDFAKTVGAFVDKYSPLIKGLLAAIAAYKIVEWLGKVAKGMGLFGEKLSPIQQMQWAIAGLAFEVVAVYDAFRKFALGELTVAETALQSLLGVLVGFVGLKLAGVSTGLALFTAALAAIPAAIVGLRIGHLQSIREEVEALALTNVGSPGFDDFLTAFNNFTRDYEIQAQKIIGWNEEINANNVEIDNLKNSITVINETLGVAGPITKDEIEKLKGHFADLHESISENLTLVSDIITTSIAGSMTTATEETKIQLDAMLAQHLLFVRELEGENAAALIEVNRALEGLVGLEKGTAVYEEAMAKYEQASSHYLSTLQQETSQAQIAWDSMVKSFEKGSVHLGGTVESATQGITDTTSRVGEYLNSIELEYESTISAIDNMKAQAVSKGRYDLIELYDQFAELALKDYERKNDEAMVGITALFNGSQSALVYGLNDAISTAERKWDELSWAQQAVWSWDKSAFVDAEIVEYGKMFDELMDTVEDKFRAFGIEGGIWGPDAMKTITGLMRTYGTTTFTPEMSQIFLESFSHLGATILPVARAFGMEIPESMMQEILLNTPEVVEAMNAITPEVNAALKEMKYNLEAPATQTMADTISYMVAAINTGQIELPAEVSSWHSFISTALQGLGFSLEDPATQAMVNVIMSMVNAYKNTGADFTRSASATMYLEETVVVTQHVKKITDYTSSTDYSEIMKYMNPGNILTYATGSMNIPSGDLFIANEAGAELVGRIGSSNAVANQEQIGDAIFQYMDAHGGASGGGLTKEEMAEAIEIAAAKLVGSMEFYFGEDAVGHAVIKSINTVQRRAGEIMLEF